MTTAAKTSTSPPVDLTGQPYSRSTASRHPARLFGCALCRRPANGWDHCHRHNTIRGPLCRGCNSVVGLADAGMAPVWRLDAEYETWSLPAVLAYRARCGRGWCLRDELPAITKAGAYWAARMLDMRGRQARMYLQRRQAASRDYGCYRDCPLGQWVCGVPLAAYGHAYAPELLRTEVFIR